MEIKIVELKEEWDRRDGKNEEEYRVEGRKLGKGFGGRKNTAGRNDLAGFQI